MEECKDDLKLSDVEDYQVGADEDEEMDAVGGGELELERLANQYMMKSPATKTARIYLSKSNR